MSAGFRSFELDLPGALLSQLVSVLDEMISAPLTTANVEGLPDEQGIYQLIYNGQIVYVGKTDGRAGLRQRLGRHVWTIQHRCNLESEYVQYKAVHIFVFTAVDLESLLRRHYGHGVGLPWDRSGFGSNDPGRERDTTTLSPTAFDALYPIDIDRHLEFHPQLPLTAAALLEQLKTVVPYGVRAQSRSGTTRKPHSDLDVEITNLGPDITARGVVTKIIASLPAGWQGTLLPGRVILYRENKEYSAGVVIARSE